MSESHRGGHWGRNEPQSFLTLKEALEEIERLKAQLSTHKCCYEKQGEC